LLQAAEHVVRDDHWLEAHLLVARILSVAEGGDDVEGTERERGERDRPSEHVDLALIHSQLADVRLEEEHVSALHAWIEDLRGGHLIAFFPPWLEGREGREKERVRKGEGEVGGEED
jgi:hypothetical protein